MVSASDLLPHILRAEFPIRDLPSDQEKMTVFHLVALLLCPGVYI